MTKKRRKKDDIDVAFLLTAEGKPYLKDPDVIKHISDKINKDFLDILFKEFKKTNRPSLKMDWGTPTSYAPYTIGKAPETQLRVDPIQAWKQAWLIEAVDHTPLFRGIALNLTYGANSTAICGKNSLSYHPSIPASVFTAPPNSKVCLTTFGYAPGWGCRCGFYASNDPFLLDSAAPFLLDVQLFGKVIVCKNGYRAARQKVISVSVDNKCRICGEPAEYLQSRVANTSATMASFDLDDSSRLLLPVCHLDSNPMTRQTLEQISKTMGTSFSWGAYVAPA